MADSEVQQDDDQLIKDLFNQHLQVRLTDDSWSLGQALD